MASRAAMARGQLMRTQLKLPQSRRGRHNNAYEHGLKDGAETGFMAAYPDCVHRLLEDSHPDLMQWTTQVVTHNLSSAVLGPRFGMLVPITYQQLGLNTDKIHLAHVLGWCVELIRASRIVCDETFGLDSNTVNINRPFDHKAASTAKATNDGWPLKHGLGSRAFADAMTLDNGIWVLLAYYFKDDPRMVLDLTPSFVQSFKTTILGRCLEFQLKRSSMQPDGSIDLNAYNMTSYKTLVRSKFTFTNYCLPVSLALHLDGISQKSVHDAAYLILNEMGYFAKITRDFSNCFLSDGDGDDDNDIRNGRLSWLIVVALQRANPKQKRVLKEWYGSEDGSEGVENVMKVYNDLHLRKSFQVNIEETKDNIVNRIQQISKIDNLGLTPEFFFRLMESMRKNDIP